MSRNQLHAAALTLPPPAFHAKPAATGEAMITFRFNARKAMQAIERMLARAGEPVDFHKILKAMYFADKAMLNAHGRPIFGATYRALQYGPVPVEPWDMLKGDFLWLPDIGRDAFPWTTLGHFVRLTEGRNEISEPDDLAEAELEYLDSAFDYCRTLTFDQRTRLTHGMDWVRGTERVDKVMDYADMIQPDNPARAAILERLELLGPRLAL